MPCNLDLTCPGARGRHRQMDSRTWARGCTLDASYVQQTNSEIANQRNRRKTLLFDIFHDYLRFEHGTTAAIAKRCKHNEMANDIKRTNKARNFLNFDGCASLMWSYLNANRWDPQGSNLNYQNQLKTQVCINSMLFCIIIREPVASTADLLWNNGHSISNRPKNNNSVPWDPKLDPKGNWTLKPKISPGKRSKKGLYGAYVHEVAATIKIANGDESLLTISRWIGLMDEVPNGSQRKFSLELNPESIDWANSSINNVYSFIFKHFSQSQALVFATESIH